MRVASSCGVEGILRRCLSPGLLKLSRLSVTSFRMGCSARQTLRPPQRTLAAIPKRSLVICTPPEARGSILRDCNHLWRGGHLKDTGAIKAPFAGTICSTPFLKVLLFEHGRDAHSPKWSMALVAGPSEGMKIRSGRRLGPTSALLGAAKEPVRTSVRQEPHRTPNCSALEHEHQTLDRRGSSRRRPHFHISAWKVLSANFSSITEFSEVRPPSTPHQHR